MKAVILAAGKSTRTIPLTLNKPKPLLNVDGKTLVEHNLDQLCGLVDEVIVIVGYKKELIQNKIGAKYKRIRITYIFQKEQNGTGHALLLAKKFLQDRFIVLMGDDLYSKRDMKRCLKYPFSVLAQKVKDPSRFGVFRVQSGFLHDVVEKPKKFVSNLANCACYILDDSFFVYLERVQKSDRGEIELTAALSAFSKDHNVKCVVGTGWHPIAYPWDLFSIVKKRMGKNCTINGKVINSIVMDNSIIEKGSIVTDSIIGENVYFSGIIHSGETTMIVNDKKIRLRIGAMIGDNVVAKKVVISPGVRVAPGKRIEGVIKKDILT